MGGWMDQAECRQYDPELFFPDRNTPEYIIKQVLAICRECEVTAECFNFRREIKATTGIWAGRLYRKQDTTRDEK